MASIFDVAKYILLRMGRLSTWKLQKLCYYSQAWSLAWTEREIFSEDFQAWTNGPVCPQLFYEHQGRFSVGYDDIHPGDERNLTEDQKETIDVVIHDYGMMEPYELRELTHQEDPWRAAREGLPEGVSSNVVISKESMGAYYGGL